MKNYKLVNPCIEGQFNSDVSASSPANAARSLWDNISVLLTGNVPRFAFTLLEKGSDKYHHFQVSENVTMSEGSVNYKLNTLNVDEDALENFNNNYKRFNSRLNGGGEENKKKRKSRDDDDDEDDSDEDDSYELSTYELLKLQHQLYNPQMINYWWYYPYYPVESVYIPTFVAPLTPYVEIMSIDYPLSLWSY